MRARVSVTTRNRLLKLEHCGSKQRRIGGWPPIMEVDDWETMASMSQDALVAASKGNSSTNVESLNKTVTAIPAPISRQSRPGDIVSFLPSRKT